MKELRLSEYGLTSYATRRVISGKIFAGYTAQPTTKTHIKDQPCEKLEKKKRA